MALKLRAEAPDWDEGKCLGVVESPEDDWWFDDVPMALAICNGQNDGKVCPLREACLFFALENKENWGVWGGMHTGDRTALRRWGPREDWGWHEATTLNDPTTRRYHPPPGYLGRDSDEEEETAWSKPESDQRDAA